MTRLRPSLPINHDETLTSYVSRLAQLHMRPSARKFCGELGIDFGLLCQGKTEAVQRLAEITDLSGDVLERAAQVHGTEGWLLRGERFERTALRRTSFAFCPACLRDDAANRTKIGTAIYERLPWTLKTVRTCARHAIALTIVSPEAEIHELRDFARQVVLYRKETSRAFDSGTNRRATSLERYIEDRFCSDRTDTTAFRAVPLYAVIRASEVFGTADLYGTSRTLQTLSPDERTAAGEAGFASLSSGRVGICDLMERIRRRCTGPASISARPSAVYGNLHAWLYHAKDPAYASIKDCAAEYIIGHSASHLRGSLFGRKIIDRPWYTIWTASVAFDIDPGRLRNVMTAAGRISPEEAALSNDRIVIPAADLQTLLQELRNCVGWSSLTSFLEVPRRTVGEFVGPGFIEPMVEKADHRLKSDLFRKSDICDLLDRMLQNATVVDTPSPELFDFLSTRRRSLTRTKDLITMLLERRLTRVERWMGASGVPSIYLDPEEVRRVAFPEQLNGPTFKKAAALLRIHPAAVNALVVHGYLTAQNLSSPREREATKIIPWNTIESFRQTYITRFELARSLGVSYSALDKILSERNIITVKSVNEIGVNLYLRSEASIIRI